MSARWVAGCAPVARFVWLAGAACAAWACSSESPLGRTGTGGALTEGMVANVDGTAIRLEDVEELVAHTGLSPREALAKLEAEALLAGEAKRLGYADAHAVREVAEQALAQALLEAEVEADTATEAEITQAYASSGQRFDASEQRGATHALAVLPASPSQEREQAARDFAREAVQALRSLPDPLAAVARFKEATIPGVELKVEVLPPTPRDGPFVPEFSAAMFALQKPGDVAEPLRTQFGWHVIVLREIIPERHLPEAAARAELAAEITVKKRKARLEALLRRLQSRTPVKYGADVKDVLAKLEF